MSTDSTTTTATEPRPYLHARAVSLTGRADDAGTIAIPADGSVLAPQPWLVAGRGVALGPLTLTPYPSTAVTLQRLRYAMGDGGDGDGWSLLGGLGLLGAPAAREADNTDAINAAPLAAPVTRRDVLVAAGVALGLGSADAATADDGVAQGEVRLLDVAEMDVRKNPRGIGISITDIVQDALPTTDQTYHVALDGERIDTFNPPERSIVPPGETGTVRVATEAEGSWWAALRGWLGDSQTIEWELQLDRPADEYAADVDVIVTAEPLVVRSIRAAGGDNTILHVGDRSVPHADEGRSVAGYYAVADDRLIYHTGTERPESATVSVAVNSGTVDETIDDLTRIYA